jgi:hypothetical protein
MNFSRPDSLSLQPLLWGMSELMRLARSMRHNCYTLRPAAMSRCMPSTSTPEPGPSQCLHAHAVTGASSRLLISAPPTCCGPGLSVLCLLMPAPSNAYWSELCAASFDGRTVPEFQRTLLAVGGSTVRAMFGPANFALILWLLQCSCRIRRALSTPASPRKHTFTLIQPHSTSRPSLSLRSPSSPSPPLFPSPTSSFTCA